MLIAKHIDHLFLVHAHPPPRPMHDRELKGCKHSIAVLSTMYQHGSDKAIIIISDAAPADNRRRQQRLSLSRLTLVPTRYVCTTSALHVSSPGSE